ncbi:AAA family ATPase [uncultured Alistipes sp.]|jgi:cellulose biosynthesis protein BcsQ|uniref:ParA family protein n=1 Tax=uncultured Alistipes sp. TaxID=538949 RepID=UPI002591AB17|nr:AAA family ATPase [uncultured Alistipes sp.]
MKAIAVFNNKGGVGKTTLLCNVASYFKVKKEQRVLIVDADPQCNATIYLFSPERINQFYNNSTQKSLYHIIQPYKKGKGYLSTNEIPIVHSDGFNIDCIIGDTRFAVLEDFLSSEWISSKSGEERALDTTFAFKNLIQSLAQSYDYIFFDIGPSLGAINRSVLIACDYFIIPMSSDIFSIKAIENIAESLHEWKEDFNRSLSEYQRKEKATYTLNNTPIVFGLQFLGYVNQQYTIKRVEGQARPVKAYDNIIRRIPAKIATKLAEFTPDINQEQLAIGEIPNLHSLIPLSQAANKPIFRLAGKDGVVGAHFKKVSEFEDVIGKISDHILSNIQVYDNLLA